MLGFMSMMPAPTSAKAIKKLSGWRQVTKLYEELKIIIFPLGWDV